MKDDVRRGAAGVLIVCLLGVSGCGAAGEPEARGQEVEDLSSVVADPDASEDAENGLVDYVVPAEAEDRCGVAEGLLELEEQASAQDQAASEKQLGERLELFADAFGRFAELASGEAEQGIWEDAESAYREAHSFYLSSGEQTANGHFLALLAEAVGLGNEAFEAQREEVREQCEVDLGELVPER